MTERELALYQVARALAAAVIVSPTTIRDDPKVCAAVDAVVFTRSRLNLEDLDGYTQDQLYDRLIAFWTEQKASNE